MLHQVQAKRFGGFAVKDMNGKQQYTIGAREGDVLIVQMRQYVKVIAFKLQIQFLLKNGIPPRMVL
jgi:hypothetical protein